MPSTEIISQVKDAADQVAVKAEEYSGVVGSAKGYIVEHFGQNGLIATYVLFAVVALLLISKLARLGWSTVKFMAIPAVARRRRRPGGRPAGNRRASPAADRRVAAAGLQAR